MCLRGASAVADMLKRHPNWKLRVFVVWEAVRATDSIGPPRGTYARIPDRRVTQFWDRELTLSQRIVRDVMEAPALLADSEHVDAKTVVWDVAAVYPAGARWDRLMPKPEYYGRPVAAVAGELEKKLTELVAKKP